MLTLRSKEVHLWCACHEEINDASLLKKYHSLLNNVEREQQQRFYFIKHQKRYLITRALVRTVLSFYSNITPKEWRFSKNQYGKPFIDHLLTDVPLYFNVSHTEGMIILAVSLEKEIGIDIENIDREIDWLQLAKKNFSPIEYEQLLALSTNQQKERFFDLWTLKEAYIKACGMGLSIPLNQFFYFFSAENHVQIAFDARRNDAPKHWNLWCIETNDVHKISMAIKNKNTSSPFDISMYDIIPLLEVKKRPFLITKQSNYL